jgi:hypothetical protein
LVFGALVRWGERNKDPSGTVGDALQDLMPLLRVEVMEVEFLRETVRPSGLVSEKRLIDALSGVFDSEKKGKKRERSDEGVGGAISSAGSDKGGGGGGAKHGGGRGGR